MVKSGDGDQIIGPIPQTRHGSDATALAGYAMIAQTMPATPQQNGICLQDSLNVDL